MTTRLLVGDVFDRMAQLDDHSFDLIVTSPPFYGVRSYLPDDHPQKHLEIGSEDTPAEYLDKLFALTAEWRRLLAPHGSLAVELGDTYAGSGGAGGDYDENGLRDGQLKFRVDWSKSGISAKSLVGIPQSYMLGLIHGRNPITGQPSPAGRWRVRNLKPWIRSNPPVGALGDKERPATSYITVACTGASRWFDLDAVRTPVAHPTATATRPDGHPANRGMGRYDSTLSGGAPPLDWWHHVDAIIDAEIAARAASARESHAETGSPKDRAAFGTGANNAMANRTFHARAESGARGVHIRRALEKAGILTTLDAYDVSPRGYQGAHYAVWPPELVRLMIDEMCPRRVCRECGVPSRRIVETLGYVDNAGRPASMDMNRQRLGDLKARQFVPDGQDSSAHKVSRTLGWSDCGHNTWRPGQVLDPFVGSGTTLAVASGMGRDSVGIDLDERSADLARERVGMFLEVDYPEREVPA